MSKISDAFRNWLSQRIGSATNYLSSHTGTVTPFRWIGNLFGSAAGKYLGTQLTGAEREANAFTAQQNQEAMAFEERMADKQMAFQAEQAATQWQRGVSDMQAAGLNPALAYGQGGASAMSGSSGAGHAGASVTPGVGSLSDLIQLATLKPTIENMKAEARNRRAEARLKEIDSETRGSINEQTLNKVIAEIDNLTENANLSRYLYQHKYEVELALTSTQTRKLEKEIEKLDYDARVSRWTSEFIDRFHISPQFAGELAKAVAIGGHAIVNDVLKTELKPKAGGR